MHVIGHFRQCVAQEDVAGDLVPVLRVDRIPGERSLRVDQVLHGRRLGKGHDDGAGRHHVGDLEALEAEEALEQTNFAVAQHAFFRSDVGQGGQFFPADVALPLTAGEELGEPLRHHDEGIQQIDERLQHAGHDRGETSPVDRAAPSSG